jgi:MFS family permease
MAVSSPFIGKLSDKLEPRALSSFGMLLNFFSLLFLYNLNLNTKIYYIYLILILLGIGNGFFASPNTNAIMGSVEKKFYGIATGTLSTMRSIGMSTSISITTLILGIFLKNESIVEKNFNLFISSIKTFSIIFSIFLFIGIFTSYSRGKMHS